MQEAFSYSFSGWKFPGESPMALVFLVPHAAKLQDECPASCWLPKRCPWLACSVRVSGRRYNCYLPRRQQISHCSLKNEHTLSQCSALYSLQSTFTFICNLIFPKESEESLGCCLRKSTMEYFRSPLLAGPEVALMCCACSSWHEHVGNHAEVHMSQPSRILPVPNLKEVSGCQPTHESTETMPQCSLTCHCPQKARKSDTAYSPEKWTKLVLSRKPANRCWKLQQ